MARALLLLSPVAQPTKSVKQRVAGCPKKFFVRRNKMNSIKKLMAVFAFSLLILGLPSFASAQWGNRDRDDDYYGRNRGGYNNGYLRSAVQRLRNNSREFARRLDRELDNSRYNDRNREDRINQIARDFERAADRLENRFGNGRNMNNSANEAQQVLNLGLQLERALSRSRLNYNVQNDWNTIRQDLRTIADAYGYNTNNRNRRNDDWGRGRNNNGNWRDRIPFPLPF
jgi:hypothetical protein